MIDLPWLDELSDEAQSGIDKDFARRWVQLRRICAIPKCVLMK